MDHIVLPLVEQPPIKGYVHHAYPLGILLGMGMDKDWIYNNYIQLAYYYDYGPLAFNFDYTFFPYQDMFEREFISDDTIDYFGADLIDLFKYKLKHNSYIYALGDEHDIPDRVHFQVRHYEHDLLIYGYEDKGFNIIGYNHEGKYRPSILPYEYFEKGHMTTINFLKVKEGYKESLDVGKILYELKRYLNRKEVTKYKSVIEDNAYFGLEAIEQLKTYAMDTVYEGKPCDIRPFYILQEHKQCMISRLKRLNEVVKGIDLEKLVERYKRVEDYSVALKFNVLKYNKSGRRGKIEVIVRDLSRMISIEEEVLGDVVYLLDQII